MPLPQARGGGQWGGIAGTSALNDAVGARARGWSSTRRSVCFCWETAVRACLAWMVLCARNTPANPALSPSGAGKSTLIVRYADDTFNDALQSTVGVDFKLKTITLLWQRVRLQ